MTEQRDQAIAEQSDRAQFHRDQATACLVTADLIRDIDPPSDMVRAILAEVAFEVTAQYTGHVELAEHYTERADVLRAHAQASAKGAPFRPVERLSVLTSVRPQQYEATR